MQLPDDQTGPPTNKSAIQDLMQAFEKKVMESMVQAILAPANSEPIKSGWKETPTNATQGTPTFLTLKELNESLEKAQGMTKDPFAKAEYPTPFNPFPEPLDELDMYWPQKNGAPIKVSQMETRHMFFALRMHFNRHVPPSYQIGLEDGKKFKPRSCLTDDRRAFKVFFHQIQKRDNITEEQLENLAHMAKVVREII